MNPAAVVATLTSKRGVDRGERERVPPGFLTAYERLGGIPVLAIRDNPRAPFDFVECVEAHGPEHPGCGVPRDAVLVADPWSGAELPPNVVPLDLSEAFCDQTMCRPVRDGVLIYRDQEHRTKTYSESLAPELGRLLKGMLAGPCTEECGQRATMR